MTPKFPATRRPLYALGSLLFVAVAACQPAAEKAGNQQNQTEAEPVTAQSPSPITSTSPDKGKPKLQQSASQSPATDLKLWPALTPAVASNPELEARLEKILSSMTLEQKVAQMIQPEIRDITVADMRKYGFGSYLNGGGSFPDGNKQATPQDWIKLAEAMYQASVDDSEDGSTIPTFWGTDAVHGHNNVIGATLFPHNIGLGAARDEQLIEKIARATAREVMVTGIDWVFAPTVAVVRDDRWGRSYEGYSEDPDIVRSYAGAIVRGLQGATTDKDFLGAERVVSTVKHFIGDGGTEGGVDQGNNTASEADLVRLHAQGYVGGLAAGAQTVMASFNSWHGVKNHGNSYLLTDVLKTRMGFDGLVVGDWNGHGQIPGCSNENCAAAANAGLDIYMVPTAAWKPLYENLIAQTKAGEIPQSRIDDAVRRILRVKLRAGLFDKPSPANRPLSGKTELIGSNEHRAIAREAVQKSMVLLKNNNILPLSPKQKVLVTGVGADNIGMQSGGWTITWQGTGNQNSDFPGGSSIYAGIEQQVKAAGGSVELSTDGSYQQKPDVAIVVYGEQPYAEGNGDINNLEYQRGNKTDLAMLKKLKADGIKVVSLFISGRPLWVNPEINQSDAFVAIWLPGSEGSGIAPVLFQGADGKVQQDFHGKLSFSWPQSPNQTSVNRGDENYQPLFPYGYGLSYQQNAEALATNPLPEHISDAAAPLEPLVLFNRDLKAPWQLMLQSGQQKAAVSSSQQKLGAVSIRSFDYQVQEDARELVFSEAAASSSAGIAIISSFPRDLRAYREQPSVLSLTLKRDSKVPDTVLVAMACGEKCSATQNISKALSAMPEGSWQQLHLNLECFAKQGVDFAQIGNVLTLQSQGALSLSFHQLQIQPVTKLGADAVVVACD
ncbi:glycoside hydrolase family 3 protein [Rheinheimera sp. 4Y26]|uniref:glycoside hydrolase family 3 protein n=1 Tax=Rheinheimera sp. 4Y26 TaxID=2977811 RepID=UPI0021B11684|nr:exo 1,3/1,4-beta-D-glucan glucohydrolase [Rheinheimera sp. 4Y26]MCT6700173.1 exo 1,3/1,4-beta-D-glucan glucohydrolase [Rheinheimera sp. 4Y26]